MHILIVEDNTLVASGIQTGLELHGFTSDTAASVAQATAHMARRDFDACVLDLGLPDGDGIDLIRDLRAWSQAPVIVLSARSREDDKIAALDAGADDYLVKPFGAGELLARVRAQLRRWQDRTADGAPRIAFGDVVVDLVKRSVTHAGDALHLTPIEYRLLVHLAQHGGRVLAHLQLLQAIWGPGHSEDTHYVRVHMANLRKKIEADPSCPRHLLTEAGVGYRFVMSE